MSPEADFGIGLRLSGSAAKTVKERGKLAEFQAFLDRHGLYVFTINGFPYGRFHGTRVKEDVYLPDWRNRTRLEYSNDLADILGALLPDGGDVRGTVSTVPGAFKSNAQSESEVQAIASNMIRHAAHLVALRQRTGKVVALAIEPEPACLLETLEETAQFFERWLFSERAMQELRALSGLDERSAAEALRLHLGVCLDLCHAAVEFENLETGMQRFSAAGIQIGKVQLSAGLRIEPVTGAALEHLRAFDDGVYLHQVVERNGGALRRYTDLEGAFAHADGKAGSEWRIHFHVPLFLADLDVFSTTQQFVSDALALHRANGISSHLEVETYTWSVLPERYRTDDIVSAVVRELQWVKQQLAA
ncbi:MAG: metabolite traffic protein EboE [Vulcanimicrobiaceae bacterium]